MLTPIQKLPKNVGDLGKLVDKGFEKLPKVQQIAQSGHTACEPPCRLTTQKNVLKILEICFKHFFKKTILCAKLFN